MKSLRILFDLVVRLIPVLGVILLSASFTSADLNDEVAVKSNSLKATTVSLSLQDTVDNTNKIYLFNENSFQKDSLGVTSLRVRNTGQENIKYFLKIDKLENESENCIQPELKILRDENMVFKGKINSLDQEMNEIISGQKNDLVFILTLNEINSINSNTICHYQLEVATKKTDSEVIKGIYDQRKLESEIRIVNP